MYKNDRNLLWLKSNFLVFKYENLKCLLMAKVIISQQYNFWRNDMITGIRKDIIITTKISNYL